MFGSLDISTSALVAQRTRLNVISANMANANTIYDAEGNYAPFRRRMAILAPGDPTTGSSQGVHVREILLDSGPLTPRYEPDHPHADAEGNVYYPNIHPAVEMINALEVSRAYEANITAAEATKSMIQSSLRLLA
jgi:flagellar basal-body rod protein FlgC